MHHNDHNAYGKKGGPAFFKVAFFSLAAANMLLADISGVVYKDFNLNGVKDDNDAPVIGATIKASCSDGQEFTVTTDSNGSYTVSGMTPGAKCRIEADVSSAGVGSAPNAHGSAPLVDIVPDGATHNISTGSPATYCQKDPDVVLVAMPGYYTKGKYDAGGGGEAPYGYGTVFTFKNPAIGTFNANDTISQQRTQVAIFDQTGAIWGAAWKKGSRDLFVSAAIKRYVPLLDESSPDAVKQSAGQIFKIHFNEDNTTTLSKLVSVPDTVSDEAAEKLANRDYSYQKDLDAGDYSSIMGLGDLDISEDEQRLYTVNLYKKELVTIDAQSGQILATTKIPNPYQPEQCDDEMVRPWALKVRGGKVYIGSVCADQIIAGDAEGYGDHDRDQPGLGAAIQEFDGSNFKTIAVTNTLTYLKPRTYNPKKEETKWSQYFDLTTHEHAPLLTDIEFNNRGDLVLGYTSLASYTRYGETDGDIRKMCLNPDGTYTDESTGVAPTDCASHAVKYKNNDHTYYEFYVGDYFNGYLGEDGHPETASGALAQAPGDPNIIVGMIDATDWYQPGAIGLYSHESGDKIAAQAVIDNRKAADGGEREPYGAKAGGMGDVELMCDPAPIEIGNYVWMDINQNGIQDPNEPGMKGVKVSLYKDGVKIGEAITDDKGHYYFGGIDNVNLNDGVSIQPDTAYKLVIAQADVNGKAPTVADPDNNQHDTIDNDAKAEGSDNVIEFSTSLNNDHTLDFGIQPALGCITGKLYEDVNDNNQSDATDHSAPAGITVVATDEYGNRYQAETDDNGTFTFGAIPLKAVSLAVDTTDTDIPEGAVWKIDTADLNLTEGNVADNTCSEQDFPYELPAPKDQDPAESATCANPTSLTWDGARVSTATKWQNMLQNDASNPIEVTTSGGNTVGVKMWIEDPDGKFYDTDTANSSGSGTSAAFGEPYLTLYLGNQSDPGDGNYANSDGAGCEAHGYYLESGQKVVLHVEFDEPVILDNWRIRDVDSGDMRNSEHNWQWQDGIKVQAYDAQGNPVEIETKIGDSGKGLIRDQNGIVHTDKDHYDAGDGDFITGGGTTANSTQGHIVITSNYHTVKELVITHLAGPDVPCQTRSALALSGFAVCKPLHIRGTVYDDKDGASDPYDPDSKKCDTQGDSIDGTPIAQADGVQLNACLVDENNRVIDAAAVDENGQYDLSNNVHPDTDYKIILTRNECKIGDPAPEVALPQNWNYEAEAAMSGVDEDVDGTIDVHVDHENIDDMDFAINKSPEAKGYERASELNPGGDRAVEFVNDGSSGFISDLENSPDEMAIKITSIGSSHLYYDGVEENVSSVIEHPDFSKFTVDPNDGDVLASFTYQVIDQACRTSQEAVFHAPFTTLSISGNLFLDLERNEQVDGKATKYSCDMSTPLYVNLVDANGTVLASTALSDDGSYAFHYNDGVSADTDYTLVLSPVQAEAGDPAPAATLPAGCAHLDGENIESENPNGTDGNPDGRIAVHVGTTDVDEINFAITPMVKIGDRLWIEDDNDGIYEEGETPVKGAQVTAVCGEKRFSAVTDENGLYTIEVPANIGECVVSTPTPAHTGPAKGSTDNTASADTYEAENNHSHDNSGTTVTVGLDDVLSVDFGFARAAAIGNYVWLDENMNGLQDAGEEPVSGVRVVLHRADGSVVAQTETNASGEYQFSNLEAGDYYLTFDERYYYTEQNVGDDDRVDSDVERNTFRTETTHLDWGERDMTWDAGITPYAHIGDYFWIDENKNGIQDPGEKPVTGARVELFDANGEPIADIHGNHSVVTDADGKYGFDVIAGRSYKVRFTIPRDLQEQGYVFTTAGSDNDAANSDADSEGFTMTVRPGRGENIPTIDAGINCGCDKDVGDGGSAMGMLSGMLMIFLSAGMGLWMIRREERYGRES